MPRGTIHLGNAVNWQNDLNKGRRHWWLNVPRSMGGTRFHNLAHPAHIALANGPTAAPPGRAGGYGSVLLDGSDDWGETPVVPTVALPITLSCVFRMDAGGGTNPRLLSHDTGINDGYRLQIVSGVLHVTFGGVAVYSSGFTPTAGVPYFVAASITGATGTVTFYLFNLLTGALQTTSVAVGTPAGSTPDRFSVSIAATDQFKGLLDDLSVFDRVWNGTGEAWRQFEQVRKGHPDTLRWQTTRTATETPAGGGGGTAVPRFMANYRRRRVLA